MCSMSSVPPLLSTSLLFSTSPATTQFYTLSLHDALPISEIASPLWEKGGFLSFEDAERTRCIVRRMQRDLSASSKDRKSTRLNSSHRCRSYAVFCLKKKIPRPLLRPRRGRGGQRSRRPAA